jgi:hypothetical protein
MAQLTRIAALCLVVVALASCATPNAKCSPAYMDLQRRRFVEANPDLDQRWKDMVLAGLVNVGMPKAAFIAAWGTDYCGGPTDINRTVTAYGVREQWVFGTFPHARYFYFENDILTSWQE